MGIKEKFVQQSEVKKELDRVSALLAAQAHALTSSGHNLSSLVLVPIEEFAMSEPYLERKKVAKLVKLHASMDIHKRGEIGCAELESYMMDKTKASAVFDSVFFAKLLDLPDPVKAAKIHRRKYFDPIRFVEAIGKITLRVCSIFGQRRP